MSNLVVIGFKNDAFRASQVLNKLVALDDSWVVDLRDAVAVYRDYRGELRLDQSFQMTAGEGAGWGLFWGSLIGGLLAVPFTGGHRSDHSGRKRYCARTGTPASIEPRPRGCRG
jgi:uncharacterized membrane protein